MDAYSIAIVGRPNAGKSTLFNKLCRDTRAIVANIPGVTRDTRTEMVYWNEAAFHLMDTSGYDRKPQDPIQPLIDAQHERALLEADGYIFLCDGQAPVSQLDYELLDKIRKQNKPIIRAVNKIDTTYFKRHESEFFEFFGNDFVKLASAQGRGLPGLLRSLQRHFPNDAPVEKPVAAHETRIIIMGRPNVGKSTLMNQLLKKERMIVSPVPGTTRDPIDSMIQVCDKIYRFIDTAGLRKRKRIDEKVESLSVGKAILTLGRADILLLVIDAVEGPTDQDIKITQLAWDRGVGVILLINKWDLLPEEKRSSHEWQETLWEQFQMFDKIPFLFISALTRRNVEKIFEAVDLSKQMRERVLDKEEVTENFEAWVEKTHPPLIKKTRGNRPPVRVPLKFYGCRQVDHAPPVFEIKTNFPDDIPKAYDVYLKRQFRHTYGFWGIPIDINYKRIH